MTKLIAAAVVVAALAFGGWKLGHSASHTAGSVATAAVSIPDEAALAAAEANLAAAAQSAGVYFVDHGSYAGLSVPGATVGSASATGYCLETAVRGVAAHVTGPNGTAVAGTC